ncbi:putative disease resistance RPP13-like protein 3 [Pistacia vera]|uniref:putative disease resistance RPP13-like protein 3 n=1 Tax=Pistacia vera TaxID=55513 RepID=UPI001262FB30|nr:putative disease resistance RPP13-like protein 3 [Pistacia vera]
MDAGIIASSLIQKLQDEPKEVGPMFEKHINNLHLLKRCLKYAEDHESLLGNSVSEQKIGRLLQAVYAVDDAMNTLLVRKELQRKKEELQAEREKLQKQREELHKEGGKLKKKNEELLTKRERLLTKRENSLKEEFKQPFLSFLSLCGPRVFTNKMKKLENEITALCEFHHPKKSFQNDIQGSFLYNDDSRYSFENYDRGTISESYLEEEEVIGFEEEIQDLIKRLTDQQSTHRLIVVFGEGGSGKTTLARSIYKHVRVRKRFTHRVWLQVSGLFKTRDFLINILKQINPAEFVVEATLSEEELRSRLTKLLNGNNNKHLIFIEDVETLQVWLALRDVLCFSRSSDNKMIVITRNTDNVPVGDGYSTLQVRQLSDEKSWNLFVKKVRISEKQLNELGLIKSKERILKVCGGLPLQVVLLGGLLSVKEQTYDDWLEVIERAEAYNGRGILALSYQDLPSQVKPCFLYMMLFPRGFEIPVRRLFHLWCAEGYMTSLDPKKAPEDLGEMYLEELVYRNMIQVRWKLDGSPKTCRIANSVYDVFCQKAADVRFLNHQLQLSDTTPQKSRLAFRRFAAYLGVESFTLKSFSHAEHVRSFVAFDTRIRGTATIETSMFKKIIAKGGLRMVKVLDLEGVYKPTKIHTVLTKLLHLRYLGLRATFIEQLPDSLGELPFLETLDVKHTRVTDIYSRIWSAKELQHLYLNWINEDDDAVVKFLSPTSISKLRTLWGLSLRNDFFVHNFLRKLTELRNLGLACDPNCEGSITDWVPTLTQLQRLKLKYVGDDQHPKPSLELKKMHFGNHEKLQDLYLRGQLQLPGQSKLEDSFFPPNLKTLTLSLSRLSENSIPVLGGLPHLNILRLFADSYVGEELVFHPKSFPKLRVLKLWKLMNIWLLNFRENSMPCLRELEIRSCNRNLLILGLKDLSALKDIELTNMPQLSWLVQHENLSVKIKKCRSLSYVGE